MRAAFLALLLLAASDAAVEAQTVRAERGDLYYHPERSAPRRLTTGGRDSQPSLSPDRRTVVFVRATPGRMVEGPSGPVQATEVWTIRVDGTGARMLLRGRAGRTPQTMLADFGTPQFSPDGRKVYFLSSAWVTSSAVHVIDLRTGRETYVCPGKSLEVVPRGEYAGHLIVQQHRYFIAGPSYDWYWLVTPQGREVGPVSDEDGHGLEQFREVYVREQTRPTRRPDR